LFRSEILCRPCSVLNRRSFIAKRLLKTKPAAALPPCFYLAAEPQILKFNPRYFAPNFAKILLAALQNSDLLPKAPPARAKPAR